VTNKWLMFGFVVSCVIGIMILMTPRSHSITWYNWRYQSHDTDVTAITNGLSHDLGYEKDDKALYICTNESGTSDPGDWVKITLSATEIADLAHVGDIPTLLSELTDDIGAYSINIELKLLSANHPVANSAILDTTETAKRLLFRDDSDTEIIWEGQIPNNYNGNDLSLVMPYSMSEANVGKYVCITAYVMAVSPGDSQDISVDNYDAVNYLSFAVPETAGYLGSVTIILTNDDGWVAGDYFRIKIGRDTTQTYGTDDATGYFEMLSHPCIIN